jgi:hypothetical protein
MHSGLDFFIVKYLGTDVGKINSFLQLDNGHDLETLEVMMHYLSKTTLWVHTYWATYNEMCAIRETTTSTTTTQRFKQFYLN